MKSVAQIEDDIMALPPGERARLAVVAWESLVGDAAFVASRSFDPEGVALAVRRDEQIRDGASRALTLAEFIAHTGGNPG